MVETALRHRDAGRAGHACVGVLDLAEARGIGQPRAGDVRDAVEFQKPALEPLLGIELTGAEFTGLRVPGENGFGPCAARRRAHAQNVLEGIRVVFAAQRSCKVCAFVEYPVCEINEPGDLELLHFRLIAKRRLELEGTDAGGDRCSRAGQPG